MINSGKFADRLQKVMDYHEESASSFAENIGVQRSSISHILSGRNKPSLDFVMKVLKSYPTVELYWLLNGKGSFPKITDSDSIPTNFNSPIPQSARPNDVLSSSDIDKIVIFYKDGTFKSYDP